MFPPRPPASAPTEPWTVAVGPTRPSETWQVKESRFLNAERCRYLVMNQQSLDWLKPVGGQSAWQRAEAVWVSTQDGTARKVHRVILQREGRVESPPAAWVEVKYELKDQASLTGQTFDRVRRDIEVAYTAMADAALPLGPKQFESRLVKLDAHIEDSVSAGVYREALAARGARSKPRCAAQADSAGADFDRRAGPYRPAVAGAGSGRTRHSVRELSTRGAEGKAGRIGVLQTGR